MTTAVYLRLELLEDRNISPEEQMRILDEMTHYLTPLSISPEIVGYSLLTDPDATEKPIVAAGDTLLYRLQLFMSGAADECANEDQPCWNPDCGTIIAEDGDWDNPSRCDVCGEACECTRCSDRTAIQDWLSAKFSAVAKSDTVSLLGKGGE